MPKTRRNHNTFDKVKAYQLYITPNSDGTLRSIKEVALAMGFNYDYVCQVASKEGWVENRLELGKLAKRQIELNSIENQVELNSQLYDVWAMFLASARKSMMKQLQSDKLGARSLKDLSDAMKNTTDKMRILSGQASDISKADITNKLETVELSKEDILELNRFLDSKMTDSGVKEDEAVKNEEVVTPTENTVS